MEDIRIGSKGCTLDQVLQLIVENEEFLKNGSHINWRQFLEKIEYMNLPSTSNSKLINALKKNKDPRQTMTQVLTKWMERQKEKATLFALAAALEDIGLLETANTLKTCVSDQSTNHFPHSTLKPLNVNTNSVRQSKGISFQPNQVDNQKNKPVLIESNDLLANTRSRRCMREPICLEPEELTNKIPISVSGGKRVTRKIAMSIYSASTLILLSVAIYQVIVLAAQGKLITRLQILSELPEQLSRAKNDFVFLSKEMMRTWSDWSQKSSQTKYLSDGANWMSTNKGYLHLHNDYDWPLNPPLENTAFISDITLMNGMNITIFFRMLKDTNNIVKLSILHDKWSLDKKQYDAKIDEPTHFEIINEIHGLRLVSVDKLKSLIVNNPLWFPYIIKAFAERISTGNLATLQIKNDAFSPEDISRLQILLSVNKKTLTTFSISTKIWNPVLFSEEFAVLNNVHNVLFNFTDNELVNNTYKLGDEFCKIFPNVKNVISLTGYVSIHDLARIFDCQFLVSLTIGVKVTRGKLQLNDIVPSNVPRSLKHVRLNINFNGAPCGIIRDNEYPELRSYRLVYSSNC